MAEDDYTDDQFDDFIHSYSYSDHDGGRTHASSDEEDASCSDSGSEPPEDPSTETEDMAIYDLYRPSPSPQPPSSPTLQNTKLELDSVLDTIAEDSKSQRPERRKHTYAPQTAFTPSARKSGDANPGTCKPGDGKNPRFVRQREVPDMIGGAKSPLQNPLHLIQMHCARGTLEAHVATYLLRAYLVKLAATTWTRSARMESAQDLQGRVQPSVHAEQATLQACLDIDRYDKSLSDGAEMAWPRQFRIRLVLWPHSGLGIFKHLRPIMQAFLSTKDILRRSFYDGQ
ncbi:hypothetical protein C8R44DRAFT_856531 [Mycena epipterygia]|nr:hypothetical protein C8R44DRAFT_856531 [Mycena epipterygia]